MAMYFKGVLLGEALGDLKIRLGEVAEKEFRDEELIRWLQLGQDDAWMALKPIIGHWYGKVSTNQAVSANEVTLPSDCSEIVKVIVYDSTDDTYNEQFISPCDPQDGEGLAENVIYDSTPGFWYHRGVKLVLTHGTASGITAVDIYYIARPGIPTDVAAHYLYCPEEVQDLPIMFAMARALQKTGLDAEQTARLRQETANSLAAKMDVVREAYMSEGKLEEYRRNLMYQGR